MPFEQSDVVLKVLGIVYRAIITRLIKKQQLAGEKGGKGKQLINTSRFLGKGFLFAIHNGRFFLL